MALPILAPALFFFGGQVFRVGSKKMADKLLKLGYKRATSKQIKAAPKSKPTVNSLEDVKKFKGTKVANTVLGTLGAAGTAAVATSKPANKTNQAKATTTTEGRMRRSKGRTPDRSKDTAERQAKTFASPISKPKDVPKRKVTSKASPTSKPKLYRTISPNTGKLVDKKVTAAQHLSNIDAYKKNKGKK